MIVLLKLRNLSIIALLVLSLSFIYIGYTHFGSNSDQLVEENEYSEKVQEDLESMQTNAKDQSLPQADSLVDLEELKNADNFFAEFRMKRDKGRDAQIEILRELVNNPNSSKEIREKAQNTLYSISGNISGEVKAENLLKAKGYEDSVVLIETNSTTVVVKKELVSPNDIERIGDLVVRATGCKPEEIAIIPKE